MELLPPVAGFILLRNEAMFKEFTRSYPANHYRPPAEYPCLVRYDYGEVENAGGKVLPTYLYTYRKEAIQLLDLINDAF